MSPLVAKEIRLLLPAFGMALLLAVVPVWLLPNDPANTPAAIAIYPFWFGAVILALSSFGREFGLKTFPLLLAQPLARSRIWWTKIALLGGASATVFAVWCLSCEICVRIGLGRSVLRETVTMGGQIAMVTFVGGLWTTLLLRQMAAAFWFTILVPAAIVVAIAVDAATDPLWAVLTGLGIYSLAGFLWAWRQFLRAQETGWTGGVVAFARQDTSEAAPQTSNRAWRPVAALFWKELQLNQIGLAAMGGLFVLHLGVVMLRRAGPHVFGEMIRAGLDYFSLIWLALPLLAGCPSIAEERKLGTMEAIMCLPVSRRVQFAIKLLFVVVMGGLLSAALLWTAEGIGVAVGGGTAFYGFDKPFNGNLLVILFLSFVALSLIAFYASTLTHNILQALATAIVTAILFATPTIVSDILLANGVTLWRGSLVNFIEWPTLVATSLCLAFGNYRRLSENWRVCLRNMLGVTMALGFITGFTAALYHRAWEFLTPLEPPRGPARLTSVKPPTLDFKGGNALAVLLPHGRLWVSRLIYHPGSRVMALGDSRISFGEKWTSPAGSHFIDGSNWVHGVVDVLETAGIRSDGTLWVSEEPRQPFLPRSNGGPLPGQPDKLARFGKETNWLSVVDQNSISMLLLKNDGTLWRWGTNHFDWHQKWPGLRSFEPHRLGADADWSEIVSAQGSIYAWKKDGRAWVFNPPVSGPKTRRNEVDPGMVIERSASFDNTKWRSITSFHSGFQGGVREDGTLWAWRFYSKSVGQVGHATNWLTVSVAGQDLIALNADGSLWKWHFSYSPKLGKSLLEDSPVRIGIHSDWVALAGRWDATVSLAADGSLWYWWSRDYSNNQTLLAPSRRPSKIENIFGQQE